MTEGELLRQDFTRDVPALSVDDLLRFQLDYPYFQAVRFLYLKKLQHVFPERYVNALHENVIYAGDRKSLFYQLEGARQIWSRLYPETEKENAERPNAFDLIDSYLESHASELSSKEMIYANLPESGAIYRIDTDISTENPAQKENETVAGKSEKSSFDLIDAFLEKSPEEKTIAPASLQPDIPSPQNINEPDEDIPEDEFLTESLAKIYIKQRRYAKALEIIRKLSLKYPEKNIYFADQIRFLEKLIINIKTE